MRTEIPWERPKEGRFTLTEWEIDPARTAFLVIDMQRGYAEPGSGVGPNLKTAYPDIYDYYYPRVASSVLPNIRRLLEFAREAKLEVIYTRMGFQLPGGRDLSPWSWRFAQINRPNTNLYETGSPEYEIVSEVAPLSHELVLDKNTATPFASTPLDQLLRNMEVENLLIAGVLTNVAVESTARSAGDRGYNPIVVEDACAAYRSQEQDDTIATASWWVAKSTEDVIQTFAPLLR